MPARPNWGRIGHRRRARLPGTDGSEARALSSSESPAVKFLFLHASRSMLRIYISCCRNLPALRVYFMCEWRCALQHTERIKIGPQLHPAESARGANFRVGTLTRCPPRRVRPFQVNRHGGGGESATGGAHVCRALALPRSELPAIKCRPPSSCTPVFACHPDRC